MSQYQPGSQGLLAPLARFLNDTEISEISLNEPQRIWIEKNGELAVNIVPELTLQHLYRLFQLIANENEQRFSKQYPLFSGSLLDGSRIQLCLPPVSKHPCFSIRRKVARAMTLGNYEDKGFYRKVKKTKDIAINQIKYADLSETDKGLHQLYQEEKWPAFIAQAIFAQKTMVISGGTSSGKTTFITACLKEVSFKERLIILEDTREIEIPHPNQVQLLAFKGEQGEAKVTMQDLLQCSLRLRPDRIIMGEIRGKEIMDFISACSTGHEGSITSIHANNPQIAFMRMTQMYKLNNVPSMSDADILNELKTVIDVIVQLEKTDQGREVQSIYYKYGSLC